jgi:hypothetical protein
VSIGGIRAEPFAETRYCDVASHTATALYCAHGQGVIEVNFASREVRSFGQSMGYKADALVVDEHSLYWIAGGEVLRVAQAGGPTEVLVPLAFGAWGDLAADAESLYFSNGKMLYRVSKRGGVPVQLRTAATHTFEVFGETVYWIGNGGEAPAPVMASPLVGSGADMIIATSTGIVNTLAVSDAGVFWSDNGQGALYAAYWP